MATDHLPATSKTDSSVSSTASSALERVRALPDRLDDELLPKVEQFALSPAPALPTADREAVMKMIVLLSDMPKRGDDDATGTVRAENLVTHLAGMPMAQLTWLVHEAHRRLTFFPSIKQLLELAEEWQRDDDALQARREAKLRVEQELRTRIEEARKRLKWEECEQEWIDALPDGMKRTLERERLLKREGERLVQGDHYRDWQAFLAEQEKAA